MLKRLSEREYYQNLYVERLYNGKKEKFLERNMKNIAEYLGEMSEKLLNNYENLLRKRNYEEDDDKRIFYNECIGNMFNSHNFQLWEKAIYTLKDMSYGCYNVEEKVRDKFKKIREKFESNLVKIVNIASGDSYGHLNDSVDLISVEDFDTINIFNTFLGIAHMYSENNFESTLILVNKQYCFETLYALSEDSEICNDCGNRYWSDYMRYIEDADYYVCCDCVNSGDYLVCEWCGDWYTSDSSDIREDDCGNYYCERCIDNGHGEFSDDYYEEDEEMEDANEYHWTSDYEQTCKIKPNELTYGFELETIPNSSIDRMEFCQHFETNNCNFIDHHDHDGSLCNYSDDNGRCEDGVEFVSKVFTYDYLKEHIDELEKFFNKLQEIGYTSHTNNLCGLHFHFAKNFDCMPKETSAKICYFVHKNWNWFVKFTRRTSFKYCDDFVSRYDGDIDKAKSTKTKVKAISKTDMTNGHYGFYIANDKRTDTSEFRMCRGTLKFSTFLASFYFINAMLLVANNNKRLTFANINKKLKSLGDYEIVESYCNERKIDTIGNIKVKGENEICA